MIFVGYLKKSRFWVSKYPTHAYTHSNPEPWQKNCLELGTQNHFFFSKKILEYTK
jgi:hypothetical protein